MAQELNLFAFECMAQSEKLIEGKQYAQAEYVMQICVDLLMEVRASDVALKFKAFRALAYCNLHSGSLHMYVRNLMMALQICERSNSSSDSQIPIAETYMDLAHA